MLTLLVRDLAGKITSSLQTYSLDLSNLRGRAYDTAALINADYPLALYLYCALHCLNLAVVSSLQVTSVHNMMGVVGRAYQFFAARPKRQ